MPSSSKSFEVAENMSVTVAYKMLHAKRIVIISLFLTTYNIFLFLISNTEKAKKLACFDYYYYVSLLGEVSLKISLGFGPTSYSCSCEERS